MNKIRVMFYSLISVGLIALSLGCNSQPAYQDQPVMASTCINNNTQQVLPDNYCDPNYIAQQREIAQQNHDMNLLATLALYNYIYTPSPYAVGYYIPRGTSFYRTRPYGYTFMPRSTYYSGYQDHTIIINNGRAVSRSYTTSSPRSTYNGLSNRSITSTTTSRPSSTSSSRSTSTYSSPTRSYSSSSSRSSFSSSSFHGVGK